MHILRPRALRLSGNTLKLIAALSMLLDHIGAILLPEVTALRILGRLSFPLFAFMIAEGAIHTRSKLRYLGGIAALGVICQAVYLALGGEWHMNILLTFSVSILLIYALGYAKRVLLQGASTRALRALACALPVAAVTAAYLLFSFLEFDYGFLGCTVPLLASLLSFRGLSAPPHLARLDRIPLRVLSMLAGLVPLAAGSVPIQFFSLLALPLLLLYSGERGRRRMKYFFYLFYPLHLAVLYGIYLLLVML